MKKPAKSTIEVQGIAVGVVAERQDDFICLTDIARYKNADATDDLIRNWLRNRNTVEFLGVWERLNNPAFNPVEFDGIKMQAGLNSFALTPKQWIERTGAVGILSMAGRYGGNMRDHATIEQLLVLVNPESLNAELIHMGLPSGERLTRPCLQTRFSAPEVRQRAAHSVSCGLVPGRVKSSGGATDTFLPLLRSSPVPRSNPGFPPGATVCRCSAARLKTRPKLNAIAIRQMRTLTENTARLLEGANPA
jgi:hypothetical protein